jgi:outer membrane protein OmpA-like peptidoglycan-associated protein/predicted nuclease with TOPRIM domain
MCDGSRAQRTRTRWAGGWLAAGIGIVSGGNVAAMPAMDTRPQLFPLILVQQSTPAQEPTAGEEQAAPDSFLELHEALAAARERLDELSRAAEAVAAGGELQRELAAAQEQNQELRAEIDALRAERDQLLQQREAAQARVEELTKAASQATATAQKIDQELIAVRWQNAQLNTSVAQARAKQDQIETEAREAQAALQARLEELEAGAAIATTEAVRLRAQLDEKEQQIAAVAGNEAEADRQLSAWRDQVRRAEQARAAAEQRAGDVEAQLADVKGLLASAERERAAALQRITALEGERDGLRGQLAQLSERLGLIQAANGQLESQVDELREAAATATDLARRNLIAVEERIRELNGALEATEPAGGPRAPEPSRSDLGSKPTTTGAADNGGPAPATMANVRAAAGPGAEPVAPEAPSSEVLVDGVKSAHAMPQPDHVASMLADLPLEKRLHVQGLLADLDNKMDERGLMTIVPGGLLFAVDSEAVQESAHDTLAKVAELISVYDDRKVLIVGHTDAVGEAAYNKQLSERRAELVKQFFVDNFEVAEDRLSTQGFGEERPIASDTTPEGRRANRRVEVLILN